MLATTGDLLGIAGVVLGFILVTLSGLIAYIFIDFKRSVKEDFESLRSEDLKELRDTVKENSKHMTALIKNDWQQQMRLAHVEDHLVVQTGYRPITENVLRWIEDQNNE